MMPLQELQQEEELDSQMSSEDDAAAGPSADASFTPTGPLCAFGTRLAFTYFAEPAPTPEQLAAADPSTYWLTIDNQLVSSASKARRSDAHSV